MALQATDSSLRWTPDLIATKHRQIVLIDCKSRMTSHTSRRHAVERAAVTTHHQLVAWTQLPLYYVFDNLDVLTPHDPGRRPQRPSLLRRIRQPLPPHPRSPRSRLRPGV